MPSRHVNVRLAPSEEAVYSPYTPSAISPEYTALSWASMRPTNIELIKAQHNEGLPVAIRVVEKIGDGLGIRKVKDADRQPFKCYILLR